MINIYNRINYYLTEMAIERKALINKVQDKTDIINKHLIKCILIQNTTNYLEHWSDEVYNFLSDVQILKNTKKYPDEKLLNSCTIKYFSDSLKNKLDLKVQDICEIEKVPLIAYKKEALFNCIIEYYNWLNKQLAKNGAVKNTEVKEEINKLIKQYNEGSD